MFMWLVKSVMEPATTSETLEVHYKEKNISQVLDMTVNDAVEFFKHIPKIQRKLQTIKDVGLGYVTLGQPATTLLEVRPSV